MMTTLGKISEGLVAISGYGGRSVELYSGEKWTDQPLFPDDSSTAFYWYSTATHENVLYVFGL